MEKELIVKDWMTMSPHEQVKYLEESVKELEKKEISVETYNVIRRLLDMKYRIMIMNNLTL